jgi:hypothetical protein
MGLIDQIRNRSSKVLGSETILKAFGQDDDFEKGRKAAQIGEEREYNGRKYKKTATGWIPVKADTSGKKEESKETYEKRGFNEKNGDEDITGKNEAIPKEDKKETYDYKRVLSFAKKATNEELENAIKTNKDEKIKEIAQDEISKRKNPFKTEKEKEADDLKRTKIDPVQSNEEILKNKGVEGNKFKGDLDLENTDVDALPDNFEVRGALFLNGLSFKKLPEGLSVMKSVDLENVKDLKELPKKMTVGYNLYLGNTQITELPDDLEVGNKIFLGGTKIKNIPEHLKNKIIA